MMLAMMSPDPDSPQSIREALNNSDSHLWKAAINSELESFDENRVFTIVDRPKNGKSIVGSRWVLRIKRAVDRKVDKYKARLVAKGFTQKEGMNHSCTNSWLPFAYGRLHTAHT